MSLLTDENAASELESDREPAEIRRRLEELKRISAEIDLKLARIKTEEKSEVAEFKTKQQTCVHCGKISKNPTPVNVSIVRRDNCVTMTSEISGCSIECVETLYRKISALDSQVHQ